MKQPLIAAGRSADDVPHDRVGVKGVAEDRDDLVGVSGRESFEARQQSSSRILVPC
jgi:hypothetical protein